MRQELASFDRFKLHGHPTRPTESRKNLIIGSIENPLFTLGRLIVTLICHNQRMIIFISIRCSLELLAVLADKIVVGRLTRSIIDPIRALIRHLAQSLRTDIIKIGFVFLRIGIRELGIHIEFIGKTIRQIIVGRDTIQPRTYTGTAFIHISKGETIRCFFTTARHREAVIENPCIFGDLRKPIGIGIILIEIAPTGHITYLGSIKKQFEIRCRILQTLRIGRIPNSILHKSDIFISVEHRYRFGFDLYRKLRRESKVGFSFGTFLGRNQQNAIGRFCSVNSRRSCIFQNLNAFYIIRVEIQHIGKIFIVRRIEIERVIDIGRVRNTVDDDKRIGIGIKGCRTTYTNRTFRTGVATRQNIHTGETSLQSLFDRRNRQCFYHARHIDFLRGSRLFTHRDTHIGRLDPFGRNVYFTQFLRRSLHNHRHRLLAGISNTLRLHTDKREYDCSGIGRYT